ncbi:hypothetical protein SDRG_03255 [Saprolegnia diclina VS20]|uniref:GST N-terminal domain-containing protein n=1 Tax=Saprolegnia diclina (strain VS20) TaxID=1156394 RepID=T0QYR6_SAPDV|nr:hypothetical protein SDRG_03255 [Saprolegnia diclina VS20]EQC39836.1 hypothetical protein SDRG_03255 [Saprolegnia diclina VS20]|eukprot:XP_008607108.1 hypothetical protein SDRG_03255 [Saprolegnia diclina VS20]
MHEPSHLALCGPIAPSTMKLTYFNTPGRAELVRLTLFLHDIPFEDERLSYEEFLVRKPTLPFQQLPTLTVDGEVFAQSRGMARYVGHLTGLYPTTDPLGAYCTASTSSSPPDVTKKDALGKELVDVMLPALFAGVEARLVAANKGGPYLLGDMLSLADVELLIMRICLRSGFMVGIPTTMCDPYVRWNEIADAVAALPKIQAWYATHP